VLAPQKVMEQQEQHPRLQPGSDLATTTVPALLEQVRSLQHSSGEELYLYFTGIEELIATNLVEVFCQTLIHTNITSCVVETGGSQLADTNPTDDQYVLFLERLGDSLAQLDHVLVLETTRLRDATILLNRQPTSAIAYLTVNVRRDNGLSEAEVVGEAKAFADALAGQPSVKQLVVHLGSPHHWNNEVVENVFGSTGALPQLSSVTISGSSWLTATSNQAKMLKLSKLSLRNITMASSLETLNLNDAFLSRSILQQLTSLLHAREQLSTLCIANCRFENHPGGIEFAMALSDEESLHLKHFTLIRGDTADGTDAHMMQLEELMLMTLVHAAMTNFKTEIEYRPSNYHTLEHTDSSSAEDETLSLGERPRTFDEYASLLDAIRAMNRAGRKYIKDDPGSKEKGAKVLYSVRDNLDALFLHLRENPKLFGSLDDQSNHGEVDQGT